MGYPRLRRPTEVLRATVQEEAREVVSAEAGGTGFRRIQILTPVMPALLFAIDRSPDDVGRDRTYKMMALPSNDRIIFTLMSNQSVILASEKGNAYPSIIIEYYDASGGG